LSGLDAALGIAVVLGDERKTMALAAQRAVVMARREPDLHSAAAAAVAAISHSRWADIAPWLWLELAMVTRDPGDIGDWIGRSCELGSDNYHLQKLTALARLRQALLSQGDAE